MTCCLLESSTKLFKNKNVKASFVSLEEKWCEDWPHNEKWSKNQRRQWKKQKTKKRGKTLTKACNKIVPICSAFLTSWPKKQQHLHMFYCLGPAFVKASGQFEGFFLNYVSKKKIKTIALVCIITCVSSFTHHVQIAHWTMLTRHRLVQWWVIER